MNELIEKKKKNPEGVITNIENKRMSYVLEKNNKPVGNGAESKVLQNLLQLFLAKTSGFTKN
jgi:hypothetical protein